MIKTTSTGTEYRIRNGNGDWVVIDCYDHYIQTKRFLFQVFRKPFEKTDFDKVKKQAEIYLARYRHINNKLNTDERIEFKHDTLDHLKSVSEVQAASKFKLIINNMITDIEDPSLAEKAAIVMQIKGDNDWNTTSPVFHHIKDVLFKYSLTSKEAKEIMLDMKGMNSTEGNKNVVEPIIEYLGRIDYEPAISTREGIKPQNRNNPKLSINQIALKYSYQRLQITRHNGNEIAKKYGHSSGEKLFQRFTFYSSLTNRKGKPNPCTQRKLKNKINLLNSVIELLSDDKKERAKDEVKILTNILENEYQ